MYKICRQIALQFQFHYSRGIPTTINCVDEKMLFLTVVQLYPLEVVAVNKVVEWLVGDQGTVVQLQYSQRLAGAGAGAQVANPLVCDELTVRQGDGLQAGTVGGQLGHRGVGDEDTLLQVHPLKLVTTAGQRLGKTSSSINTALLYSKMTCRYCRYLFKAEKLEQAKKKPYCW